MPALIARLDQPRELPVQMIQLNNANAAELAQVVESIAILPAGAAISVDRRSNAIVPSAPMRVIEWVQMLVARLDTQQNNVVSRAVPLAYADASALADVVLRAIESQFTDGATQAPVRIVPEPQTNTLLISAPQERIADIIAMMSAIWTNGPVRCWSTAPTLSSAPRRVCWVCTRRSVAWRRSRPRSKRWTAPGSRRHLPASMMAAMTG